MRFIAGKLDDDLPGIWELDTLHVYGPVQGKEVGTALICALVHHAGEPTITEKLLRPHLTNR